MDKRILQKLVAARAKPKPEKRALGPRKPTRLSLLDLPDEEFRREILGVTDAPEDKFLLDYSRWTSPLWSGPSVRMTINPFRDRCMIGTNRVSKKKMMIKRAN